MELSEITKKNIERVTGVPFEELLEKKPVRDPRLKALRRRRASVSPDLLVRGNPELTLGHVTTLEEVDAYWDKKIKERGDECERRNGKAE